MLWEKLKELDPSEEHNNLIKEAIEKHEIIYQEYQAFLETASKYLLAQVPASQQEEIMKKINFLTGKQKGKE